MPRRQRSRVVDPDAEQHDIRTEGNRRLDEFTLYIGNRRTVAAKRMPLDAVISEPGQCSGSLTSQCQPLVAGAHQDAVEGERRAVEGLGGRDPGTQNDNS